MSKIINFILRIIAKIFVFVSCVFISLFLVFVSTAFIIAHDGEKYTREQRFESLKRISDTLKAFFEEEKRIREERKQNIE